MDDRTKEIVENNLGLVGDRVKKLNLNFQESEEMFQVGVVGLIKAAQKYDPTRNATFATYATRCIDNEFYMEFRKRKKQNKETSIETPIKEQEGESIVLGDMIEDERTNVEGSFINNEVLEEVMDIIINYLSPIERYVFLANASGMLQRDIGKELNLAQSYISRIIKRAVKRVRARMNSPTYEKNSGKYNIKVISEKLFISFYGTQEEIESRICEIDFPDYIPVFEITYEGKKACISLPAESGSMHFIAKVLKALEDLPIKEKIKKE